MELFLGWPELRGLWVESFSGVASEEVVTGGFWEIRLCRTGKEGTSFSPCCPRPLFLSISPSGPQGWTRTAPSPILSHWVNHKVSQ